MQRRAALPIAIIAITVVACSRDEGVPAPPAVNLAFADMGGAVEELTGNYGPGFTGRRLIDGLLEPTWKWAEDLKTVPYPQDAVISFFEREPATISGLTIVLPEDTTSAPKKIEVSTAMENAEGAFTKVAAATLEARAGEQTISFPPVVARFVKFSVLSGYVPETLEIAEIKVIETVARDYTPLFVRAPTVKLWQGSPRAAAQRGLDWLQHAAPVWINKNNCFGCHVHGQVLMGQAIAEKQGYRVNMASVRRLDEHLRDTNSWGSWFWPEQSATVFGAMGVAYAADILEIADDKGMPGAHPFSKGLLLESSSRLVERQQEDGALPVDEVNPPIVQGQFMTTADALVALKRAAAHSDDPIYDVAAERGLSWIASHEPETNQDKIFKVIALMHYGTPEQKSLAWSVVETLATEQRPDGGWQEHAGSQGSNAIATGQVLYAFKQAGVSIQGELFRRGVDFLLAQQVNDPSTLDNGSWAAMNTDSERPSNFAHTMWAVIGLAGAYGADATGALRIVRQQGDKPPARHLEIILDASGSMKTALGESTRWAVALDVLRQVVDELPEDLNVGLRIYGHRHSSKSAQTCNDSELVVPIAKLDRSRMLAAASKQQPRGETPLVYSVLQGAADLQEAGGGSVILITDGEESCKGDAAAAAAELQTSGLDITLNVVAFTLVGEQAEAELGRLAGATGGAYYRADDGAQLTRAVLLAAMQRLPYDILDASGNVLVSGQTSQLSRELAPGSYRIRIDALGQILEEPLDIVANETTSRSLGVEGDHFVIRR